jgi:ferritin
MLKLVKFINERGGHAIVSDLKEPPVDFKDPKTMFQQVLDHEIFVSKSINELVSITLEEKDYATHNFLQWYVSEQIEEEALARNIIDKLNLISDTKNGYYMFDKDINSLFNHDEM